jgi:hypothetical protein
VKAGIQDGPTAGHHARVVFRAGNAREVLAVSELRLVKIDIFQLVNVIVAREWQSGRVATSGENVEK